MCLVGVFKLDEALHELVLVGHEFGVDLGALLCYFLEALELEVGDELLLLLLLDGLLVS